MSIETDTSKSRSPPNSLTLTLDGRELRAKTKLVSLNSPSSDLSPDCINSRLLYTDIGGLDAEADSETDAREGPRMGCLYGGILQKFKRWKIWVQAICGLPQLMKSKYLKFQENIGAEIFKWYLVTNFK